MKLRPAVLLVAALAFTQTILAAPPTHVLFIGNSYTAVNDLPTIFKAIVASTGTPIPTVNATTPGGKTLEQHLHQPETVQLIDQGNWDVVILQGQSLEAAMAEQSPDWRASFLRGATGLCDRIKLKNPNARIVFYETWARHADYWKDPKADRGVGNNPAEMQARIRKWYRQAAEQQQDCVVAPVGDAWELSYQHPRAMRLHAKDNSHPGFNGSYLAALVIYATIYQPTSLAISYHGNLKAEAGYLQGLAAQAIHAAAPSR